MGPGALADRDADDAGTSHFDRDQPGKDGSGQNRDIGARFNKAGAAEHLMLLQMLWQDGIFDRAKESRVDAHRKERQ